MIDYSRSYIHNQGATLAANGFPIVPIAPNSKRPVGKGWQEHPWTVKECLKCLHPEYGVGILFGYGDTPVYGLDADIDGDKDLADKFYDLCVTTLNTDLTRTGKPPKFLMLVRAKEVLTKQTSHWFEKDGRSIRLEFLGKGQQAVAFGIHPTTGKPYEWNSFFQGIEAIHPQDLPEITVETLNKLITAFGEMAEEAGYIRRTESTASSATSVSTDDITLLSVLEPPSEPLGLSPDEATRLISESGISNEDYDSWLKVGMALHHEFAGRDAQAGLQVWDQWSSTADSYNSEDSVTHTSGRDMIEAKWDSFGQRKNGRSITMRWVQSEWRKHNVDAAFAKDLSETGIEYRFLFKYGDRLRFVADLNQWLVCNGGCWAPLSADSSMRAGLRWLLQDVVLNDLQEEMKALYAEGAQEKAQAVAAFRTQRLKNTGWLSRVGDTLKTAPAFWARLSDFDASRQFFALGNGVYDLNEGVFHAPNPLFMIRKHSNVMYDPHAKCPLWEQTVDECMAGDKEKVAYLKRFLGYALLGRPVENKFHIFEGAGANGKSLILNVLREIFGTYCVEVDASLFTSKRFDDADANKPQPALVGLAGARLALCSEVEQGAKLREALVKRLTGMDWITARALYSNAPINFQALAVLLMATNYKPEVVGIDNGIWRRQEFLRFPRDFESEGIADKNRADKLKAESSGIFNWMLEGLADYRAKHGLKPPLSVLAEVKAFREEMDIVTAWLDDKFEATGNHKDSLDINFVWNEWVAYAKRCGYVGVIATQNQMTRRVRKFAESKEGANVFRSCGRTRVRGLRLREAMDDFEEDA